MPVAMHCPRCKLQLEAADAEELADLVMQHLLDEHGHQPPREHVLARIEGLNPEVR